MKITFPRLLPQRSTLSSVHVLTCMLFSLLMNSLTLSAQTESYNWGNVAIGGGGFVSAIITQNTASGPVVYARTDVGGAYRWDPAQNTWLPLLDWAAENQSGFMGTESLAIDPQNPNRVYILAGISYFNNGNTAILKSTNYGQTFTVIDVTSKFKAHGNGMGRQNGEKLQVDPLNSSVLYCGTRWNGLFKSTDEGVTWNRLAGLNVTTTPNENGVSFVVLDKSKSLNGSTQRIFAGISRTGSSSNLYKSEDGGQTFTAITNASLPSEFMPQRAALDGLGNLYVTYANGAGPHGHWAVPEPFLDGAVWKYNIANNTWTNVTPLDPNDSSKKFAKPFGGISVDPNNAQRIIVSTTNAYYLQEGAYGDRFFISTNGGQTYTDVVARGFDLDPNGITWVQGHAIHWSGSIMFDPNDSKKVWVTSGNGVFVNPDIDATVGVWKFTVKGLEELVPRGLESIPNGPLVTVVSDYDGFRHTDVKNYAPIHEPRMGTTTGIAFAQANTSKLLRAGGDDNGGKLFYSLDQGATWTQCAKAMKKAGQVCVSQNGTTEIFIHSPQDTTVSFRSTNRGTDWTAITGLSINNARIVVDGSNNNKFYAYNPTTGALMISNGNNATSFTQAGTTATGGSTLIRTIPGKDGHLWVALNGGGLARSTNSGTSFSTISSVTYCGAVGFGKEISAGAYPTLYIWGTVNNVLGLYRSTNEGADWTRVNDDAHEYGGPANGQFVQGDRNIYGRVYMSTAGRGVVYGEALATTLTVSPATLSVTSAATTSTITVTSNSAWTVSDNQTWLSTSLTSGSGNGTFTISAQSNTSSTSRSGNVTVTSGSITQTITVTQSGCTSTTISPYLQINGGSWQATSSATLAAGGTIKLGPQPSTGGSWSWTGPNGFSATTREISIASIQTTQGGNYIATYTNASGCKSTHTFTITVTGSVTIIVRARATTSDASISLKVNNSTVGTWTLTTTLANYSVTTTSGAVSVHFTNDGGTRDVQIDYVTIGGVTYQAEIQPTNTGVWQNSTCGGSNSEWLHCNGYINFTNSGSGRSAMSESTLAQDENLVSAYPNPVSNVVTLKFNNDTMEKIIVMVDASGKTVMSHNTRASEHLMDLSTIRSGLYLIRVAENSKQAFVKITKK
jgi:xyloglucan-specific exo-beta-1,4-glucanase